MASQKMNSYIVFKISRDDLTEMIKSRNEDLTDKQINKIITSIKNTDYVSWLEKEVKYYLEDISDEEEEEDDKSDECCICGNVSNKADGNLVYDDFWCVYEFWCEDCLRDSYNCFACEKFVKKSEYLPSKEDEEKQELFGNDYCLECYKKVEKFEFVENIEEEE